MGIDDIVGDAINNIPFNDSLFSSLPPEILSRIDNLITIAKAAGIVFIIYILFLIVKGILAYKRTIKISQISRKVNEIDKKLDLLIKQEMPKEKKKIRKKVKKK